MDKFNVTIRISNYPSKEHRNSDEPTRYWQEMSGWITACCFYQAVENYFSSRGYRGNEFIEEIVRIRRKSDNKEIGNIKYQNPVEVYYPAGSYCSEHIR